jgi:phosphatidylglycerol:prolipoprotein diacylglycerol transferase
MVHHPLLASFGGLAGLLAGWFYARRRGLDLLTTADALAAPLALGFAFEQWGALLAGSGYGVDAQPGLPWAVTYSSVFAARMSGTPLGVPLHPVQGYAALGLLGLCLLLLLWRPRCGRPGDMAGAGLMGLGVLVFLTELWRDTEGRGRLLGGALDVPQLAAVLAVLAGAWLLSERKIIAVPASSPLPQKEEDAGHE